ncbi:MAG: hypothetical protein ACRCVY_06685 [Commensalibacter sp.]
MSKYDSDFDPLDDEISHEDIANLEIKKHAFFVMDEAFDVLCKDYDILNESDDISLTLESALNALENALEELRCDICYYDPAFDED